MDTLQATTQANDNSNAKSIDKSDESEIQKIKLEAMVTPEQVLSASVARKRRSLARKHPNRAREQTPGRDLQETTSDEDRIEKQRPKTPERRRKKSSRVSSLIEKGDSLRVSETNAGSENKTKNENVLSSTGLSSRDSIPKQSEPKKKDSLVSITQMEVKALFNKAKKTLISGRDRARHKKTDSEAAKRSQSVPTQFTENDLLEGLRKAHLLNETQFPKGSNTCSDSSDISSIYEENLKPKPYRPIVQDYVAKQKLKRQASPKIIELLDPKTSKVIRTINKRIPDFRMTPIGFIRMFRYVSIIDMYRVYKIFKSENRAEYERIKRLRNRCITNLMVIMILCGLGGIVFRYIEGAFENFYKCGVKRVKRDFIDILWHRSHNLREEDWKSLARNKLRVFEEELHTAHEAGMHTYSGQRSWSFMNGIVYCLTVVTTIGYGHIYPTTITGQALTIVYAIIGIPLFLIALTDFGKLFTRAIKFVWSFVRRVYYTGSCRTVRKTAHVEDILQGAQIMYEIATLRRPSMFVNVDPKSLEEDPENPKLNDGNLSSAGIGSDTPTTPAPSNFEIDDEFNLPISVAIFILVLYIFLGAVMYSTIEQWDFFAAFYFVFISMSTIGFGDYVPRDPFCMIISIVYLVFGLALMSMCINVVQVKLSDTFKDASVKLGATIGINVSSDDGSISTVTPAPIEIPEVHIFEENGKENGKINNKENKDNSEKKKTDTNASKKLKKSSMKVKSTDDKNGKTSDSEDRPKTPKEVKF